ncbi:MAG: PilZ domain-containing protein [Chloroflexi bacterium]|jgi:hypothetical protein|nr:PilZ domain-containing protein [Anaerolineaceae bacterium]NMB87362.1 PilZ domain-containing protein [Chloroflexota bacterium]
MTDENMPAQRRQHFRINYPARYAPVIMIRGRGYQVIDLSEVGIRFVNARRIPLPDDIFQAEIRFNDGETVPVVGKVIRIQNDQVAMLLLIKNIPYRKLLSEQAFLREVSRR